VGLCGAGLSLDVAAAEAAATPPEPASAHAQRAELLAAATRAAEEELAELDMQDRCARPCTATPALPGRVPLTRLTLVCWRDSTSLQKQRQCLEALRAGCQRRSELVEDLVTDAEPRTRCPPAAHAYCALTAAVLSPPDPRLCRGRYELSLYANITNVTWQLDRGSAYVRGTVSDMVGRDIRNIDLDPSQLTTFQLVNAVWDSLT